MRLLVCGDRDWINRDVIFAVMKDLPKNTTIIHGAARGADQMAAECALELDLAIDRPPTKEQPFGGYPARWTEYGRRAGPIRNQEMLIQLPELVYAFHPVIWDSRGTKDMLTRSLKVNTPCYVFTEDGCKHRAEWEPNLRDIELYFESFGPGVLHKYPSHYGPTVSRVEILAAKNRIKQLLLYDDVALQVATQDLPRHPGICDCDACNEAYGNRRQPKGEQ